MMGLSPRAVRAKRATRMDAEERVDLSVTMVVVPVGGVERRRGGRGDGAERQLYIK